MPNEGSRITARKTVILPSGETIDVPVITQISFIDPGERYQETEHHIDNSADSNRIVHVDQVHNVNVDRDGVPTDETPIAGDDALYVERIDTWNSLDPLERAQETQLTLDNATGNDLLPPHFTNHERTHIYRYHKDPQNPDDEGVWIDSELIDEFAVIDPQNRHQETHYTLTNPTNEELRAGDVSGQADPTDPDITIAGGQGEGTETNPVRLDPFQNIVNYSSGIYLLILFTWNDYLTQPMGERCTLTTGTEPFNNTLTQGVATRVTSAEDIDIVCVGDAVDSLLNGSTAEGGQPEVVTTELFSSGYPKFPDCYVCGAITPVEVYPKNDGKSSPGDPAHYCFGVPDVDVPLVVSDPVPYNRYERSFLFEIAASESDPDDPTAGNSATTKVEFEIFGVPAPRLASWVERTLPTAGPTPEPPTVPYSYHELNFNGASHLGFTAFVYNKSAVDLYLTDKAFPLRKKGSNPTAPGIVEETKQVWKTRADAIGYTTTGYGDEGNMLHEPFSDAEVNTSESGTYDGLEGTGSETVNLRFHFEKFNVGPGISNPNIVSREICWPVEPKGEMVSAITSINVDNTYNFSTIPTRQYEWVYKINGTSEIDQSSPPFEKDWGSVPHYDSTS